MDDNRVRLLKSRYRRRPTFPIVAPQPMTLKNLIHPIRTHQVVPTTNQTLNLRYT